MKLNKSIFSALLILAFLTVSADVGVARAEPGITVTDPITISYPGGWSNPAVGTWDAATKTATLTADLSYATPYGDGFINIVSDGITLDGNGHTLTGTTDNGWGVFVDGYNRVTIKDLTAEGFGCGIQLSYAEDCVVTGNDGSNNLWWGISICASYGSIVTGNTASDNGNGGIHLYGISEANTVAGNTVSDNGGSGGIRVDVFNTNGNQILDNTANNNVLGITISGPSNTLKNNVMSNNDRNFAVNGAYDTQDIDTSNLVDGKPIYYVKNAADLTFDASTNAGVLYLINCDSITVTGLSFENNLYGILLVNTHNSKIENNDASTNILGFYLDSSSNNTLTANTISNSDNFGIFLSGSDSNTLTGNTVSGSGYFGVILQYGSDSCTLTGNTISGSGYYGILLSSDSCTLTGNTVSDSGIFGVSINGQFNRVYNNNFINNLIQASSASDNDFYLDKPIGGNYWSDYTGTDADGDGFGDSAYTFTGGEDIYPWMEQDGWASGTTPPVAEAGGPYAFPEGFTVTFDAGGSSDPDGDPLQYRWDFDSNGVWDTSWSTDPKAQKFYDNDYYGTATVEVSDGEETDTDTASVEIWNVPPSAHAHGPYEVNEGDPIVFTGIAYDAPGDTLQYAWVFDDTYPLYIDDPSATMTWYDNARIEIRFYVRDDTGEVAYDETVVHVLNIAPTVEAGPDQMEDEGSAVTVTASFSDPGADTHTAKIHWGDGSLEEVGTITGNTVNGSHVYTDNGVYDVKITVTDDDSGEGEAFLQVTVNNVAPTAYAGGPYSGDEASSIAFTGSASDPGSDTHEYRWNIDGAWTAWSTDPSTSYTWDDDYSGSVTLEVRDDDGGVGSASVDVSAYNVAPSVDAGADQTADEEATVDFDGSFADPGADVWTIDWDFGDNGSASGSLDPTHVYADDGVYTVTLTVTDDDHGVGTDTLTVTVDTEPPTTTKILTGNLGENGWYTSDVEVSLTATDPSPATGVKEIRYRLDGIDTVIPGDAAAFTITTEGIHALEHWAVDNAGNAESIESQTVNVDKGLPTGSVLINAGDTYTTSASVTLTSSSSDATSGIWQVRYGDDGTWDTEPWESPFPARAWTLTTGDGEKTVYYQIMDNAGLESPTYSDSIILDTMDPTTNITFSGTLGDDGWYVSDVQVSFMVFDDGGSGVEKTEYSFDGATWTVYTAELTIATEGTTTLYYRSTDYAGNVEPTLSKTFKIDKTEPIITAPGDLTVEATSPEGATVTYMVTATDNIGLTSGPTCSPPSGSTFPLVTTTVTCTAGDAAGNTASASFTVTVEDTTPPTTTITSAVDGDGASVEIHGSTLSDSITLTFTGSDIVGVEGFEYSLDGGAFSPCASLLTLSGLSVGDHSVQVRAIDTSGNVEPVPVAFSWTILTPGQASQNLIDLIGEMDLPESVQTSLAAPLKQAMKVLDDDNPKNDKAAVGKLNAFINKAEAQRGKKISDEQADQLMAIAQGIKNVCI